jgi:ADP-heptose:LPS heptosyltransferase
VKSVRILVLRGGAIGDFIVTLPALQALRERWPDGYIELIGYPHVARLAGIAGIVSKVESLDRAGIARLFSFRPTMTEEQIAHFRTFDVIINYLHDPDGSVAENLKITGARTIIHCSPLVTACHAVDHFVKPLESLAIYAAGSIPRLRLVTEKPAAPFAALHPGSGSPKKNWPAARFIELARRIADARALQPVFVLGEADEDAERELAASWPHATIWRQLPLPDLAARLAGASSYVGKDSGISHLAAALGIPSLALFGPSSADLWSPRGDRARFLRAPDGNLDALTVDEVFAALP